jgi:K+-sensing histidine kinase KdpD
LRTAYRGYLTGAAAVLIVTLALLPFRGRMNSTPVALSFLLAVLFTAASSGRSPALITSLAAIFCFNFFFLPPYYTLIIDDPQNWVALGVFFLTSLIAGGLSAREKKKAQEAESKTKQVEQLYSDLQKAFEKASKAEALEQSEKLKSALLDAVSHELRTPLTSMKAAVTTLLGDRSSGLNLDDEARRDLLEVMRDEVDRLDHIVEALIDVARIEAGAMHPRRRWTQLEEIISIALSRTTSATDRHQIQVDLAANLPPMRIDEKAIAEVIHVLIENAAKYSPENTEILLRAEKTNTDLVTVIVEDQGPGIPLEFREKVFDKFFRVSGQSSGAGARRTGGLGMGLAIARGIVEAHGGKIWIENAGSGNGTRVLFTIPLKGSELPKSPEKI